jgi:hypothetical protein
MYDFRFYQACMGQPQLVYKIGWGYSGVYRRKFRESKGVKFFSPLSHRFVFLFIMGLGFFSLFQKGFFWVRRGGWGNSTPFQRRFFLGMGTNSKGCFLGGMGG